ncbi:DNA-directed RNA polymerase III subunit RPC1 [Nosema bombycis CQ1]|uniref:DNA-directed RNA polymerase subunit n=1 Tax=Nosema bombycis (strain CQ1 / CVCC 102059) TaxID=578461 RepID=R0KW78_NOSB1|nr:DNA-directed RNA polymerase III subunit RPC1 [Nosema bombycis CQ1]|eukprot:EOB14452.1 DNA-directed RNA polymerase III subunit RPC1 [Nosema bombycis CQ1]
MNEKKMIMKSQVDKISFSLLSSEEIKKLSVHTLTSKDLYDVFTKTPMSEGPLDRRLGVGNKQDVCLTCDEKLVTCVGHFGDVKLALPVFHIGLIKQTIRVLSCVCRKCGELLLSDKKKLYFRTKIRECQSSNDLTLLSRSIVTECKKVLSCPTCYSPAGTIKKGPGFKILHEVEIIEINNADKDKLEGSIITPIKNTSGFDLEIQLQKTNTINSKLRRNKKNIVKKTEDLNPQNVLNIFKMINTSNYEILGMRESPEKFLIQNVIVPPACLRPSVGMDEKGTNEDDITIKISEIIHTNNILKESIEKGNPINLINDDWDHLQLQCALLINSDLPQVSVQSQPIRGIVQRLKGKAGRFRCNLSGKRVDFSGRTVISPNPNLAIDQVNVPEYMAKILTIPEKVTEVSKERLTRLVKNGPLVYPGANYIIGSTYKKYLLYGDRNEPLRIGDTVERHLMDGDIVLFNRQPSLHRMSIMAHFVKTHKNKTLRFNECVCAPYNADFDGDEMNIHVPQTVEAMAECVELMGVKENIITARHGEPLIAATQDFITALYLITSKDTFFDRPRFAQLIAYFATGRVSIKPAISKPVELFTGKQLVQAMISDALSNCKKNSQNLSDLMKFVTLETKNRSFASIFDQNDGYVLFDNGEYLCGRIDKSIIGGEAKKSSLLYVLLKIDKEVCAKMMFNMTKVASRYLGEVGFSIGLIDVLPGPTLQKKKERVVTEGYKKVNAIISKIEQNDVVGEMEISCILNKIREDCGNICINELSPFNSPIIMQACGSKGSKINVSQMIACVGQQIISGKRIPNGMLHRTLPLFKKHAITPIAKGFVENSFYTGMTPPEFFFHAVSGREGLVDTAVKTAETGYMQRRLMKALEDLSLKYDYSVRTPFNDMVQYKYGDDGIDPLFMECDDPIDLPKLFFLIKSWMINGKIEEFNRFVDINKETWSLINELNLDPMINNYCLDILNEDFVKKLINFIDENRYQKIFVNGKFTPVISFKTFWIHLKTYIAEKLKNTLIEPGTAVGAIAGQSIGEPGTQMTLKTFHFAVFASMNITLGVPRLKEIINAVANINTPIINVSLTYKTLFEAQAARGRIMRIQFKDICKKISTSVTREVMIVDFELDTQLMKDLCLKIDANSVKHKLNITEQVSLVEENILRINLKGTTNQSLYSFERLKKKILNSVVSGISTINKVVIHDEKGTYSLILEGSGLQKVFGIFGVDFINTIGNGILETQEILGIEAARSLIINEIEYTVGKHGIKIDPRHVMLLADTMTYKGEVLGITRFGISKMSCSTLMLASFEQTADHLFEAAIRSKEDEVGGVSESIILGKPISLGTGGIELFWDQ